MHGSKASPVKFHANHVSVGEDGGEYFQVSFDSKAPSEDDDDFDLSAPAHPIFSFSVSLRTMTATFAISRPTITIPTQVTSGYG